MNKCKKKIEKFYWKNLVSTGGGRDLSSNSPDDQNNSREGTIFSQLLSFSFFTSFENKNFDPKNPAKYRRKFGVYSWLKHSSDDQNNS